MRQQQQQRATGVWSSWAALWQGFSCVCSNAYDHIHRQYSSSNNNSSSNKNNNSSSSSSSSNGIVGPCCRVIRMLPVPVCRFRETLGDPEGRATIELKRYATAADAAAGAAGGSEASAWLHKFPNDFAAAPRLSLDDPLQPVVAAAAAALHFFHCLLLGESSSSSSSSSGSGSSSTTTSTISNCSKSYNHARRGFSEGHSLNTLADSSSWKQQQQQQQQRHWQQQQHSQPASRVFGSQQQRTRGQQLHQRSPLLHAPVPSPGTRPRDPTPNNNNSNPPSAAAAVAAVASPAVAGAAHAKQGSTSFPLSRATAAATATERIQGAAAGTAAPAAIPAYARGGACWEQAPGLTTGRR
ncbi:hypothetical protein ACSSS7_004210 [Eimeria intestinalis]